MKTLEQLKSEVLFYCSALNFPNDATDTFCAGLESICSDTTDFAELLSILSLYEETELCDYPSMLQKMKVLCEKHNIHEYTSAMLLFLLLADKLKSRYFEKGIPKEIFYNTLFDLRYKLDECSLIHGVFGTSAGWWYAGFFRLTRFALGRLQFEIITIKEDVTVDGVVIPNGSKAINIHIPRTLTPLDRQETLDSYKLAGEFFSAEFIGGPIIFACDSWLLYPWLKEALGENSNIVRFANDFTLYKVGDYEDYALSWRVFDKKFDGDILALPSKTTLQRAFLERIKSGLPIGWGRGIFIYK